MNKKIICIVSYLTILGFFIALLFRKSFIKEAQYLRFHLRQSLGNMLLFFLLNILLVIVFYYTDSIVSKEHILNNGKEFSGKEYNKFFINEGLVSKYKYPKTGSIDSDNKLAEEIATDQNLLSPSNLFFEFNIPGFFIFKKLKPNAELKNKGMYEAKVSYLEGIKYLWDEKRAKEILDYGSNSNMDENLYNQLQKIDKEIQTSFLPYEKERKQAMVNYIIFTLEDNSFEKIHTFHTPLRFNFLSESIFWVTQLLCILIWVISVISIYANIKLPFLGSLYQKLFYFI